MSNVVAIVEQVGSEKVVDGGELVESTGPTCDLASPPLPNFLVPSKSYLIVPRGTRRPFDLQSSHILSNDICWFDASIC